VFATLVSTGRHNDSDPERDHRTPTGSFRIREKHISTTMDDDSATDGPYSIEDVPWVMYFDKGYALHGAFWHSGFGREHSHGCVNINPHDARQLFEWVGPSLPPGWHAVRATHDNQGTRVVVHDDAEKPDAGKAKP
jgi:lipoprotein-anchoring transpeptidase ErfK/SrfK